MQEAAPRAEAPLVQQIAKVSEQFYVVSAFGIPMSRLARQVGTPEDRLKATQARVKKTTVLRRGGKPAVHAEQAAGLVTTPKGMMFRVCVSSHTNIEEHDKDVFFESDMGAMKIKARFALKNMVYNGGLAL